MGGAVALAVAVLATSAYDPVIDTALDPHAGLGVTAGVHRLQDDFGLFVGVSSPRFLDDHLSIGLAGGVGWHPDLRALPMGAEDQDFGAWSTYGHLRLTAEFSTRIALGSGRLYAALGPSALWLSSRLSTTRIGLGVYGALGLELFAGDNVRAYPFSFFVEIGAVVHAAAADVANRTGAIEEVDPTVDRPIATGLAISGGLRVYLWK